VNFFRSIGSAFGVAIFGAILSNRLNVYLPQFVPAEALRNAGAHALTASPEQLRALPDAIHHGVVEAFARSVHVVFLAAVPAAVLAFLLTWLLQEIPLRETAHVGMDVLGEASVVPEDGRHPALPQRPLSS
jgi:uncharacterized membrane protein